MQQLTYWEKCDNERVMRSVYHQYKRGMLTKQELMELIGTNSVEEIDRCLENCEGLIELFPPDKRTISKVTSIDVINYSGQWKCTLIIEVTVTEKGNVIEPKNWPNKLDGVAFVYTNSRKATFILKTNNLFIKGNILSRGTAQSMTLLPDWDVYFTNIQAVV